MQYGYANLHMYVSEIYIFIHPTENLHTWHSRSTVQDVQNYLIGFPLAPPAMTVCGACC